MLFFHLFLCRPVFLNPRPRHSPLVILFLRLLLLNSLHPLSSITSILVCRRIYNYCHSLVQLGHQALFLRICDEQTAALVISDLLIYCSPLADTPASIVCCQRQNSTAIKWYATKTHTHTTPAFVVSNMPTLLVSLTAGILRCLLCFFGQWFMLCLLKNYSGGQAAHLRIEKIKGRKLRKGEKGWWEADGKQRGQPSLGADQVKSSKKKKKKLSRLHVWNLLKPLMLWRK